MTGTAPRDEDRAPAAEPAPAPLRKLALPLGAVVALVLGGLIVAGLVDDSSHVQTLGPGDCFRAPEETQIVEVDRVDCAEPHEFEVFAAVEMADDGAYPGDQQTFERGMDACRPRLEAYVGRPDPTSPWRVNVLTPAREGWEDGDRTATCVAYRLDEGQFFATVEGSARAPGG